MSGDSNLLMYGVLLASLVVLLILLGIEKVEPGRVQKIFQQYWPLMLAYWAGFTVLPGAVAILWGFLAAAGLSGIVFVACMSTTFLGGFGGQWVGPGALERKQADADAAAPLILPALLDTILFYALHCWWPFPGLFPWTTG